MNMRTTGEVKLVFSHSIELPPQQPKVIERRHFEEVGVRSFGARFLSVFAGVYACGIDGPSSIRAHMITAAITGVEVREVLGMQGEIPFSLFLAFLWHFRFSPERYLFLLVGGGQRVYEVSASWYGDSEGWFVFFVSPDRRHTWCEGGVVISM